MELLEIHLPNLPPRSPRAQGWNPRNSGPQRSRKGFIGNGSGSAVSFKQSSGLRRGLNPPNSGVPTGAEGIFRVPGGIFCVPEGFSEFQRELFELQGEFSVFQREFPRQSQLPGLSQPSSGTGCILQGQAVKVVLLQPQPTKKPY